MDAYEATRIVLSRVQNLDPENASKIMGLLLIQDNGEKEMIRLAFGPEALLHSVVLKTRKELGFSSSSPSTPSSPSPFLSTGGNPLSRQNSSSATAASSRLSISTRPWSDDLITPNFSSSSSSMNSSAQPFYAGTSASATADLIDELQLQEQLSFLNDTAGNWGPHRRSFSVSDICLGSSDDPSGFGWKQCLYYARGYCKNGSNCRFLHGGVGDISAAEVTAAGGVGVGVGVGSPPTKYEMLEQCQELLRFKSASQLMNTTSSYPHSPSSLASKCANFLLHQQQSDSSPRGLMRSELAAINGGLGMMSPGSRQIYLTFPADSTFREEDVSNYFSIYGPVQDVRIPYQQKRMFGFVTFIYPETVKLILAKGNPHFVCDARVLVKPYKEKGKIPDKFRKQQMMERGLDYSVCGSPTGLDSRDPFDIQIGQRMFSNNTQELLWRRKMEEQADLQQAIELHGRRLMSLQLLDVKRQNHNRTMSAGVIGGGAAGTGLSSPTLHSLNNFSLNSDQFISKVSGLTVSMAANDDKSLEIEQENLQSLTINNSEVNNNYYKGKDSESSPESLEHNLPDSPFASPKAAGDFSTDFPEENAPVNNLMNIPSSLIPPSAQLDLASFNSWHFQVPRLSSANGAIGM
ncbi:zinc finger CCCH domain-containing protein 53-like [Impatiens glandulifera]|uniref:zinc finger CCCH domain-containing protein 53-like n=1 Tax=Impatiens glandulifera TaxID=253017 RepID=UPI001FB16250|nr:zinc finger CCCH domain-containing protein 53-like [Impatiens glandulifera]